MDYDKSSNSSIINLNSSIINMITINKLQKNFGEKRAVDIESYIINQVDMLGLVGNNGAGKTTLFRLMLDLLKADA